MSETHPACGIPVCTSALGQPCNQRKMHCACRLQQCARMLLPRGGLEGRTGLGLRVWHLTLMGSLQSLQASVYPTYIRAGRSLRTPLAEILFAQLPQIPSTETLLCARPVLPLPRSHTAINGTKADFQTRSVCLQRPWAEALHSTVFSESTSLNNSGHAQGTGKRIQLLLRLLPDF